MGNLGSVCRAIRHLGFEAVIRPDVGEAEKLVIPGVGAFGSAMQRLGALAPDIRNHAIQGRPLLGICLGQQLLFEESEEFGRHEGLGLLPGKVKYFPGNIGVKVPHVGWNELVWTRQEGLGKGSVAGEQTYFVHSLVTECADPEDVAAKTNYGVEFASAVMRKNVWGTQFHPEKSGEVGLRILRNFLEC